LDAGTNCLVASEAVVCAEENRPIPDMMKMAAPASVSKVCALLWPQEEKQGDFKVKWWLEVTLIKGFFQFLVVKDSFTYLFKAKHRAKKNLIEHVTIIKVKRWCLWSNSYVTFIF